MSTTATTTSRRLDYQYFMVVRRSIAYTLANTAKRVTCFFFFRRILTNPGVQPYSYCFSQKPAPSLHIIHEHHVVLQYDGTKLASAQCPAAVIVPSRERLEDMCLSIEEICGTRMNTLHVHTHDFSHRICHLTQDIGKICDNI